MIKVFFTTVAFALLSGCATVFTGTNQAVNVTAIDQETKQDLTNVNCSVIDPNGGVHQLVSNPGTVIVSKGKGPLQIQCDQQGYKNYTAAVNSNFNAVTLLDILFWPTFFVDYATGAMQKYPAQHAVVMSPKSS